MSIKNKGFRVEGLEVWRVAESYRQLAILQPDPQKGY